MGRRSYCYGPALIAEKTLLMYLSSTMLIVTAEIGLVLLAGGVFLFLQNRRLRQLSRRLQHRMSELVSDIQESRLRETNTPATTVGTESYSDALEKQLALTRDYHRELGPGPDIATDLNASAPLPRRVAALRYAMLIAERDAQGEKTDQEPSWEKLNSRYTQLLEYYRSDEVEPETTPDDVSDIELLQQELLSYKKRVVNLEKFKTLYFELEKRWESCSEKAQTHYDELSAFGEQVDSPEAFDQALGNYQAAFRGIAELVEQDPQDIASTSASARAAQQATGEIRHLRNVAADQHRLIFELQSRLAEAATQEEANEAIEALQEELNKQLRYVQESETCIQLLEDELNNAHQEVEQSRSKLQRFGMIRAEHKDLLTTNGKQERMIFALKNETQRLKNKLRAATQSESDGTELKKELSTLKIKYAELEERYLDIKMKS